jgi:hypothetical protein
MAEVPRGSAMPRRRGAVVIGVNKTGGLPVLESSAIGAEAFGRWLASEDFEVSVITDAGGPVTPTRISEAIESFVRPGNCYQLIIYFSGHGYWKNDGELWLLTDAPADANAAISWIETAEFAKDCGIPNVVLVSDACRSIPTSPQALRVRGSVIFPNETVQRARAKIDKFMAAAIGTAAYEVKIGNAKENVFTRCFLNAFTSPDPEMIQDLNVDGEIIKVIPNRRLAKYLQREVPALLSTINVQINQVPDAEVLSDDDAYIGRARSVPSMRLERFQRLDPRSLGDIADVTARAEPRRSTSAPVVHLREVADMTFARALDETLHVSPERMRSLERLAEASGFNDALAQASTLSNVTNFKSQWGFAVLGEPIADAIVANGEQLPVVAAGGKRPGIVNIGDHLGPACTVLIRFTNGRATPLAALQGFIGHVLVSDQAVINVSYIPSDNSDRWRDYIHRRDRLARLRAAASAAVRFGVFRLDEKKSAAQLAEDIRVLKGLDPSLGLYAAYAYSQADQRDDIDSVREIMSQDLQADLFDVAMLTRQFATISQTSRVVPFCPMLTQGWNLLRARGVQLPRVLDEAEDELEQGLWTTFKPIRAQLIFDAARRGEIA